MKALQNLLNAVNAGPFGHKGAINHNHWQAQLARRVNLRPRAHTTRILGDDVGDAVRLQQVKIGLQRERAARTSGVTISSAPGPRPTMSKLPVIPPPRVDDRGRAPRRWRNTGTLRYWLQ